MEPRHNQNNEIKTLKRLDNQLSYQGNMYSVQVLLSKMAFELNLKFTERRFGTWQFSPGGRSKS